MKIPIGGSLVLSFALVAAATHAAEPYPPNKCESCEAWNAPQAPFRVFGNTYYVGTQGLSSLLVTSDKGHVLLDGALPQSAPLIAANIRALGFQPEDVQVILNSHAHFDHAGGIAELQVLSGARVLASPKGAAAIRLGKTPAEDPQHKLGAEQDFPAAGNVHEVKDGEIVRVGDLAVTSRFTPGHTPGGTTWTWRSCEGTRCLDMVYADSLTAVSAPDFRFSGEAGRPGVGDVLRRSIAAVAALPCDVLVSTHPSFSGLEDKLKRRAETPEPNPFIDPQACRTYAAGASARLDKRLEEEGAAPRATAIGTFFESFAREWVRSNPQRATALQYFTGEEQDRLDRQLTPVTRRYRQERIDHARRGLTQLRTFDRTALSAEERVSYVALEWQLDDIVRGEPFLDHAFHFEQMGGVQRQLTDFLANTHPLRNARDAENLVARLDQVEKLVDSATAEAREQGARGILPPAFILDATIGQMERFVAPPAAQNYLVTSFAERLGRVSGLEAAARLELVDKAQKIVSASVYPAWQRALTVLREQRPRATADAGLWRLPGGEASYRYALRRYTTTEMTPDEVHELGLKQVAAIEAEMDVLLKSLGHTTGSVRDRMKTLRSEAPEIPGPDARVRIVAEYERLIRDAEARSDALFDLRPKAPVIVKREPEVTEQNAAAHYSAPARDGSLPGIFWVPLPGPTFRALDVRRTLAYHEAVPGHHFQLALQQEMPGLPRFRQDRVFGGLSAYSEGWALYAERVAAEGGWYEGDVPGRLVQLDAALFRARRLVVDTGLHAKRWTRQQVIDYGMSVAETERYVVFPGQACSYMVGLLRILALRDTMKAALGDRFSLREFHNVVLSTGTVPLDVLEGVVNDAITAKRASP
jgi:uncharacterized protein (DUF885 family)/glyoxylase-like metal-dependent hydrolase (beta-lactamase superfamily II)